MRIAVDALGGDHAPGEIVAGAIAAARHLPQDEIVLIGHEPTVRTFAGTDLPGNLSFVNSSEAIGMGEEPAATLRARPDTSVAICARMVREGNAGAMFSAGSTGATVTAALLLVGRIKGVRRPAIATFLPFERPVILLDAGATVQCRAQDLLNFAILGGVFTERYLKLTHKARVGLINVGEESGKGDDLTKKAYRLLDDADNVDFVGNVEGRDISQGAADVLVTDGFTGNVMLKTAEGVSREMLGMVRDATKASVLTKLAAAVLRPRLYAVRDRVDPENYGGSFLLGVNGAVVIGHGNSRSRGVRNALSGISHAGAGMVSDFEREISTGAPERAG